jgi:hypothetical protein
MTSGCSDAANALNMGVITFTIEGAVAGRAAIGESDRSAVVAKIRLKLTSASKIDQL